VGRYQKGKTNLNFTEARDNECQWRQLGHMQVCTLLQTDNRANTPPLSFLQAGHPSCRPANSVKALNAKTNFGAEERSLLLVELPRPQSTFSFCTLSGQYTANSSGMRRHLLVAFYSVDQLRPLLFQVIFKNLKRLN